MDIKVNSEIPFKRISVVGLGYIGLPTAAMFASCKVEVVGVDVNQLTVDAINQGQVPIVEPGLDLLVRAVVEDGYLRATATPEPADAFLITVPTPFAGENHEPDLGYIKSAALAIAKVLKPGDLVVLESTSPVGATEMMADWLLNARPDLSFPQTRRGASDIRIAYCPERVLPGNVMQELITNDRVIGGMTPECSASAICLYQMFVSGECVIASSPRAAEMVKLTENSFRDVNIAFANELSLICYDLNIDVREAINLANRHPRVDILRPGPGVGGHCIAVDPWFLVSSAPTKTRLIATARDVNDGKCDWVVKTILEKVERVKAIPSSKKQEEMSLAIYGLAFKPNIDDLRGSPALKIATALVNAHQGTITIYEPNINKLPAELCHASFGSVADPKVADLHIVLVAHTEFLSLSFSEGLLLDFCWAFTEGVTPRLSVDSP